MQQTLQARAPKEKKDKGKAAAPKRTTPAASPAASAPTPRRPAPGLPTPGAGASARLLGARATAGARKLGGAAVPGALPSGPSRPLELTMCKHLLEDGDCFVYRCPAAHSEVRRRLPASWRQLQLAAPAAGAARLCWAATTEEAARCRRGSSPCAAPAGHGWARPGAVPTIVTRSVTAVARQACDGCIPSHATRLSPAGGAAPAGGGVGGSAGGKKERGGAAPGGGAGRGGGPLCGRARTSSPDRELSRPWPAGAEGGALISPPAKLLVLHAASFPWLLRLVPCFLLLQGSASGHG